MAYLGKYIRQILSRQEPVILPGFGSLVITQSGSISTAKGRIDPPGVLIKFDAEHPKDDGKLAAEYATGENIDPEEAGQQVLELIDAIKFKLDKGEKYDLDLVGTFSRDDDNRVRFDKDPNWIIDPDLFGLPTLDLLELEEDEEVQTATGIASKGATTSVKEEAVTVQKEPVHIKNRGATELGEAEGRAKKMANRAPVNKWRIIWIVVGTLIIVLVLILLIPSKNGDYGIEFSKEGIVLKENIVGEDIQDAEVSNELVTDEVVETQAPVETINNFFIIAGSFQKLQNATVLMESLKADGFPAEIIMTESRLYRVSVQSYPEQQQAVNDLVRIKKNPGLGGCWVWVR